MAIIVETPLEVQSTPFKLDMGQHSWMGIEPNKPSNVEAADAFSQRTSQIQEEAKATLEHVVNEMKHCYTQSWQDAPKYKEGDMGWLNLQNNTTRCPIKKLDHKWSGPFKVAKAISPAAVKLNLTGSLKGSPIIISLDTPSQTLLPHRAALSLGCILTPSCKASPIKRCGAARSPLHFIFQVVLKP